MVSPSDAMDSVARAIANSGKLPSELSVLLREADVENDDANVDMPLLELQPTEVDHIVVENSDFAGWTVDDDGNKTGRIYESEYQMTVQIDIWTSRNDGYDVDNLAERLRDSLYPHTSHGPQQPFLDESGSPIDDLFYFSIESGDRVDDLLRTPTVRRWRHEVELWASEQFTTDKDYIATVDYPASGDLNDTDGDGVISDT